MTPDEIADQISPYLDAVVDIVHDHGGMVDKFIGDAVMAVWGFAPSDSEPTQEALDCARAMVTNAARHSFGGQAINIGVGLNAGRVFIGNVGGEGKRQFTVLGTPVNLAARFESESKTLCAPVVVGQDFFDRLPTEARSALTAHPDRPIKGANNMTLYTLDPAADAPSAP